MKLNGGVIIIGSLLWEDHLDFNGIEDSIRSIWREQNLKMDEKKSVSLPIRYGRISSKRFHTYTMIFCNSVDSSQSKGFIIPFCETINSFEELYIQAIAMAKAEGIYTNKKNKRITTNWGSVGILINPTLEFEYPSVYSYLVERWETLYSNYQDSFKSYKYSIQDIPPVIDQNGFMQIEWKEEFKEFDFLLATPTEPHPQKRILEVEITNAIFESRNCSKNMKYPDGYSEYFYRNRAEGIITYQDERINEILNQRQQY